MLIAFFFLFLEEREEIVVVEHKTSEPKIVAKPAVNSEPVVINSKPSVRSQRSIFENGYSSTNGFSATIEPKSPTSPIPSIQPSVESAKKSLVASIRESIEKRNQNASNGGAFTSSRYRSGYNATINPKKNSVTKSQIPPSKQTSQWAGDSMNINIVELTKVGEYN